MPASSKIEAQPSQLVPGQQGVCLSADAAAGELLLQELPLAAVVADGLPLPRCQHCFTAGEALRRCSRCHAPAYCGRACQQGDWCHHKLECASLQRVAPHVPGATLRLAARIVRNASALAALSDSVAVDDSKDAHLLEVNVAAIGALKGYLSDDEQHLVPQLHSLLCKLRCNVFSICDAEMNPVGSGFFPQLRRINHSCTPNCAIVFRGPIAFLRAAQPLAAGTELTISYVPITDTRRQRLTVLKEQFGFACRCARCERELVEGDVLASMRCPVVTDCPGWIPLESASGSQKCTRAHALETEEHRDAVLSVETLVAQAEEAVARRDAARLAPLLPKLEAVLPPWAHLCHAAATVLVDEAINAQEFSKALTYARIAMEIYNGVEPLVHDPVRAINSYRLGRLAELLGADGVALQALTEAVQDLRIFYGGDNEMALEAGAMLDAVRARAATSGRALPM